MIEKNWVTLIKPKKLKITVDENNPNQATLIAEPLEKGFGLTLGTALRRVLLSSLPGGSVFSIRIDGIYHEFTGIVIWEASAGHVIQDRLLLQDGCLHCRQRKRC